jgi:hypothetical protein
VDVAIWVATGAAIFFGYVAAHEWGHWLAARSMGIPADEVSIRFAEWPAHVALQTNGQWHSPGSADYQVAYALHDPELRWLGRFIAAGFVIQTITMALMAAAAIAFDAADVAARLVRVSVVVNGLYLVVDAASTALSRSPSGDMSSLLRHKPTTGIATFLCIVGAHVAVRSVTN